MSMLGNATRVGIAVLVGIALFAAMFAFFTGGGFFKHTYSLDVLFDNVDGITPNVPVELAGVEVGQVKRVSLTAGRKADLTLEIKERINGHPVLIPTGSEFTISSAILGGSGVVMIVPPVDASKRPGDNIQPGAGNLTGTRTGDISATMSHANALLDQLTTTTKRVDSMVADPALQDNIKQTTANLNAASANGVRLTYQLNRTAKEDNEHALRLLDEDNREALALLRSDNADVKELLHQTRASSQVALGNLTDTTASIKSVAAENRAKINQIVANMNDTTRALAGITQQADDLLSTGGVTKNLSETVANLNATSAKLGEIADSLKTLTTDPKLQGNLKETVQNIKDSSEETKYLLQRLNKLAGTKRHAVVVATPGGVVIAPNAKGSSKLPPANVTVPLMRPRVDLVQNGRASHFRADVDAIVPLPSSKTGFARAGMVGIGDSNGLILQYGNFASPKSLLDYRYGLYDSKLAIGGDLGLGKPETLSFDLYDPDKLHVDAKGVLMLFPEIGLLVGGDDLTRHAGVVFGLEYRSAK